MTTKRCRPVPMEAVEIRDTFWSPIIETNRLVTIPREYELCKSTGRIDTYRLHWKEGDPNPPHIFWDSDVAKWLEAASFSLVHSPDPALDGLLDEVIALIASSQQPDGYLNSHYTAVEPENRWLSLKDCHELYCAGHMIEAGVAHHRATGKRELLDVVCRYAGYIGRTFGTGEGQLRGYCGHEEIELALVKLYHATGDRKYLELSSYFVEERGRQPHYFDVEAARRGDNVSGGDYSYFQAHKPVRGQEKATGHSVRAMYLYTAMADLADEFDDESLLAACERLWNNLLEKQIYVTGGIGGTCSNEGFLPDFDLPNETAYCETCAAIGFVFWAHRMLRMTCDGKYADAMELALYNAVLCGCAASGDRFFYANPLASFPYSDPHNPSGRGQTEHYRRSEWFDCACCPPNYSRLIASLGDYVYGQSEDELAVHLYVGGEARVRIGDADVVINQRTNYPWDGDIGIAIGTDRPTEFTLKLRLPQWCGEYALEINGADAAGEAVPVSGYLAIRRMWKQGDTVRLKLEMPVRRVYSHPDVRQNTGCAALMRGPLVYCLEQADHTVPLHRIALGEDSGFTAQFEPDLLGGAAVLKGMALAAQTAGWEGRLYRTQRISHEPCAITAIPYYLWSNREPGDMRVWIPELTPR